MGSKSRTLDLISRLASLEVEAQHSSDRWPSTASILVTTRRFLFDRFGKQKRVRFRRRPSVIPLPNWWTNVQVENDNIATVDDPPSNTEGVADSTREAEATVSVQSDDADSLEADEDVLGSHSQSMFNSCLIDSVSNADGLSDMESLSAPHRKKKIAFRLRRLLVRIWGPGHDL